MIARIKSLLQFACDFDVEADEEDQKIVADYPIDATNFSRTDHHDAHHGHDYWQKKTEFEEVVPPPDERMLEYY